MKVFLTAPDRDLDRSAALPVNADALVADLGLDHVFLAMAEGDRYLYDTAKVTVLTSVADPATIRYRQAILLDCLRHPAAVRELEQAIACYDQAIEAYPGYEAASEEKADAQKLKGRYDQALETSIWAKENAGRTVEQIIRVAQEYEEHGDVDRALVIFRQAIAVEPGNALAHAELGRFFIRMHRYADALTALEEAYRLDPAEPGVAADLAMVRGMRR